MRKTTTIGNKIFSYSSNNTGNNSLNTGLGRGQEEVKEINARLGTTV